METDSIQRYSLIAKHGSCCVELEMSEDKERLDELISELVENNETDNNVIEYMIVSSDEAYSLCKEYILYEDIDE